MSRGLLHVNLNVADLDRSLRFWTGALGFRVVSEEEGRIDRGHGEETVRQAVLTVEGSDTLLALTQAASLPLGAGSLNHLGLILDEDAELEPLLARVEELGGRVGRSGRREEKGVSETFAYVRDPDGHAVELSTQAMLYSLLRKA